MTDKICKDCKHYQTVADDIGEFESHGCFHPRWGRDPILGEPFYVDCQTARKQSIENLFRGCGPFGKWWEARS
jgi:hypothetical protein